MKYNTVKPKLIIPEYGRNIQTLIYYAKTIEDKEERQAFVEKILELMQQMHPQARNVEDYKAKLWSHLVRIGNYELDIDIPDNVTLEPLEKKRPNQLSYPDGNVKFRHYGRNVQEMIAKAIAMEDKEKQADFTHVIGAYMKMAYKSWNQPVVSDENIIRDLKILSGDQLEVDDNMSLDDVYSFRKRNNNNNRRNDSRGSRGRDNRGRDNRGRDNRGRDNRGSNNYKKRK